MTFKLNIHAQDQLQDAESLAPTTGAIATLSDQMSVSRQELPRPQEWRSSLIRCAIGKYDQTGVGKSTGTAKQWVTSGEVGIKVPALPPLGWIEQKLENVTLAFPSSFIF